MLLYFWISYRENGIVRSAKSFLRHLIKKLILVFLFFHFFFTLTIHFGLTHANLSRETLPDISLGPEMYNLILGREVDSTFYNTFIIYYFCNKKKNMKQDLYVSWSRKRNYNHFNQVSYVFN